MSKRDDTTYFNICCLDTEKNQRRIKKRNAQVTFSSMMPSEYTPSQREKLKQYEQILLETTYLTRENE